MTTTINYTGNDTFIDDVCDSYKYVNATRKDDTIVDAYECVRKIDTLLNELEALQAANSNMMPIALQQSVVYMRHVIDTTSKACMDEMQLNAQEIEIK